MGKTKKGTPWKPMPFDGEKTMVKTCKNHGFTVDKHPQPHIHGKSPVVFSEFSPASGASPMEVYFHGSSMVIFNG
jgi:hypothetical protein